MSAKKNEAKLYARPFVPEVHVHVTEEKKEPIRPYLRLADVAKSMEPGTGAMPSNARPGRRGVLVTHLSLPGLERALSATTSGGEYLSKTSQPVTVVEALQTALVCAQAGARFETPEGDWSAIPRVATVGAAAWIDPDVGSVPDTSMTFGAVVASPKLVTASAVVSRTLNLVTNRLAERTVVRELLRAIAAAGDRAALLGSGVDAEPLGIAETEQVAKTSGAAFSWTTATELIRVVEAGNATPTGWMLSPATAKILRGRQRFTGTDSPILDDSGKIAGIPAFVTTGMTDGKIIVGDFTRLVFRSEAVEVVVDNFSLSTTGALSVVCLHFMDTIVEHPAAFAVAENVS